MVVSIVDVAKKAGVSHMTVSRVLSRSRGVKPENVAAVMKAVEELGYVPPLRKRGPKPKRYRSKHRKILLVVPRPHPSADPQAKEFLDTAYGQDLLAGIVSVADRHPIDVQIVPHSFNGDPIDIGGAAGIMQVCPLNALATPLKGLDPAMPLVILPRNTPVLPACDCVAANEQMIGELAVNHLLERGCTRMALLTIDPEQTSAGDVYRGFKREALRRDVLSDYIGPVSSYANGPDEPPVINAAPEIMVDQLTSRPRMPDGLVVGILSISRLYDALRGHGIEPVRKAPSLGKSTVVITPATPELLTNPVNPMPHLLGFDHAPAGRALVEQLLRRIENPGDPVTHLLVGPKVFD